MLLKALRVLRLRHKGKSKRRKTLDRINPSEIEKRNAFHGAGPGEIEQQRYFTGQADEGRNHYS
jgi:hypothetical protein